MATQNSKTPIYISYAWRDEREAGTSREDIVDRLYQSLKDDGYDVRRDKMDLGYKRLISDFMKEIGRGACIIAVISDKYLRSQYCMFELLEIYRNAYEDSNFDERLFPIVLSEARIHDVLDRSGYTAIWVDKRNQIDTRVKEMGHEVFSTEGSLREAERIRDIGNHADKLLSFVANMNTLTPALIEDNDFGALKRAIDERLAQLKGEPI